MFVAALSLFIFILTPYGRAFMKAKQGLDRATAFAAEASALVAAAPGAVSEEEQQVASSSSFSSCRLPRRQRYH